VYDSPLLQGKEILTGTHTTMSKTESSEEQNMGPGPAKSVAQPGQTSVHIDPSDAVIAGKMVDLRTIQSSGIDRDYLLYVPSTLVPAGPYPLVVELHGSGLSAEQQMRCSGFHSLAQEHGFVVAAARAVIPLQLFKEYPTGFAWNVPGVPLVHREQKVSNMPNDIEFIRDLIADVRSRLPIDAERVYVAGFSGGGRLASHLAFLLRDIVAAIGTVSGLRIPTIDTHGAPCPIIAFHGLLDRLNPFEGGAGDRWREPVMSTATYLALTQGCRRPPVMESGRGVTKWSFQDDRGVPRLVQYAIADGNHSWPGSVDPEHLDMFGETAMQVDATRAIWEFFSSAEGQRNS
jgi:polyhydroxybutyrate depolymerase